jgi:hypothetical protein
LETPEEVGENDYTIRPLESLSAIARRLGCPVVVREAGADKEVLARIEPDSYERISERAFLTGATSLCGRVERVGGATKMRCALRVPLRARLLYCKVANAAVARELGKFLYQEVAVTGTARWIRKTWNVVGFTVDSVYQPKAGSLSEAFQALRDAGGQGWDEVNDPQSYLEEVSGK